MTYPVVKARNPPSAYSFVAQSQLDLYLNTLIAFTFVPADTGTDTGTDTSTTVRGSYLSPVLQRQRSTTESEGVVLV